MLGCAKTIGYNPLRQPQHGEAADIDVIASKVKAIVRKLALQIVHQPIERPLQFLQFLFVHSASGILQRIEPVPFPSGELRATEFHHHKKLFVKLDCYGAFQHAVLVPLYKSLLVVAFWVVLAEDYLLHVFTLNGNFNRERYFVVLL